MGKKFDSGKVPVNMGFMRYFPRAILAVAMVSEYGFRKYGSWGGWRDVPNALDRYADAKVRHMLADSTYDEESGLAHAVMEAWNAMALVELLIEQNVIEARKGNEIERKV